MRVTHSIHGQTIEETHCIHLIVDSQTKIFKLIDESDTNGLTENGNKPGT